MQDFTRLNTYHVDTLTYYLDRLQSIPDGDGTLLDATVVLYGSGMSDGNIHNNYNVPVVVVGGPERGLRGNRHPRVSEGHAAGEPVAEPDGQVRRARGAVRRQHRAPAAAVGRVGTTPRGGPRRRDGPPMTGDAAPSRLYEAAFPFAGDVLALPVEDIDRAAEWYAARFGLTEVERRTAPCPTVIMERDGVRIGFCGQWR